MTTADRDWWIAVVALVGSILALLAGAMSR